MALLIALDIDGTTIGYDEALSERVRSAVTAARDAGHHVVLTTGRTVAGTVSVARELGLTSGYAVCSNGAVVVQWDTEADEGYRILQLITFDPAPVLQLLRAAMPEALVAVEEVGVGQRISAPFPEGELSGATRIVPWEELGAEPVTRLTFRSPDSTAEEFVELAETIGLQGVNYAVGFTAWMDISPEGVSKAYGLEEVRSRLGVPRADTVAVGDQRNDLEMLGWAGHGVAMGQAPVEVQDAADEVTDTVDDDGLARVLERVAQSGQGRPASLSER